jgi:hypothetical protein
MDCTGRIWPSRFGNRGGRGHAGARLFSTGSSFHSRTLKQNAEKVKAMKKTRNDVGYGRPPIEHQFKPGRSGNPFGRPKGARRFTADLLDELGEIVAVTSGDQKRAVTKSSARSSTC